MVEKNLKIHKYVEIKQHTLKQPTNQKVKKEVTREIRKLLRKMKITTQHIKIYGIK